MCRFVASVYGVQKCNPGYTIITTLTTLHKYTNYTEYGMLTVLFVMRIVPFVTAIIDLFLMYSLSVKVVLLVGKPKGF